MFPPERKADFYYFCKKCRLRARSGAGIPLPGMDENTAERGLPRPAWLKARCAERGLPPPGVAISVQRSPRPAWLKARCAERGYPRPPAAAVSGRCKTDKSRGRRAVWFLR